MRVYNVRNVSILLTDTTESVCAPLFAFFFVFGYKNGFEYAKQSILKQIYVGFIMPIYIIHLYKLLCIIYVRFQWRFYFDYLLFPCCCLSDRFKSSIWKKKIKKKNIQHNQQFFFSLHLISFNNQFNFLSCVYMIMFTVHISYLTLITYETVLDDSKSIEFTTILSSITTI